MPLINILTICGEDPLVVISIFDCSDQMLEGSKEDYKLIGQLFKNNVTEFDPLSMCTDAFFLMVLAMFKKLEKLSVQHVLEYFVFMEASMCCLYFSLTWLTSDQLSEF